MMTQIIADLEIIFKAALENNKYNDAIKAKYAQYEILMKTLAKIKDLDQEELQNSLS